MSTQRKQSSWLKNYGLLTAMLVAIVAGCVVGATAVTLLPEVLRFTEEYYWLIFGIITLLFVIFLPYGFISLFQKEKREEEYICVFGKGDRPSFWEWRRFSYYSVFYADL